MKAFEATLEHNLKGAELPIPEGGRIPMSATSFKVTSELMQAGALPTTLPLLQLSHYIASQLRHYIAIQLRHQFVIRM
jgi:hypothetical protein